MQGFLEYVVKGLVQHPDTVTVTPVERRLPGADGGVWSLLGGVVKVTTLLCWDALPAASNAPTEMS